MRKLAFIFLAIILAVGSFTIILPAIAQVPIITEFTICTRPENQSFIDVSGNIVVWTDLIKTDDGPISADDMGDVYGYDLLDGSEFTIATGSANQGQPVISGDIVVWSDNRNGNWDIYGYNITTDTEFPICIDPAKQGDPAISGNIVVWVDERSNNYDIYAYNIITKSEFAICTNPSLQQRVDISGDIVVWEDWRNGSSDIYGYDLNTGTEFAICTDLSLQDVPAVAGDMVVWRDSRNDDLDIYGYNISNNSEFAICSNSAPQSDPVISGDIVMWVDARNGWENTDIYGYKLDTNMEFAICTNSYGQGIGSISEDIVVWTDMRNGNSDIYGARIITDTPINPIYSIDTNLKVEVSIGAEMLNDFIRNKGTIWVGGIKYDSVDSPLNGLGQAWVDASVKYDINSIYLMAHAIQESGWGFSSIAQSKYNIYGYGAYDADPAGGAYTFSSYEECIDKCAGWINANYLTLGGKYYVSPTLRGMNVNYATDPNWGENIAKLMNQFVDSIGWIQATVHSPTELRVYDSHGLVTGVVNGEERNEIPSSVYYDNTATILSPTDSYSYEVIGIGDGLYDMTITKLVSQESTTFATTDIPTVTNMVHQYTINWDSLSVDQESVTVQIDSDGDGTFESTITADKDLTRAEYLSATGEEEGGVPVWLWPAIGVGSVLLLLLAVIIYLRMARKKPSAQAMREAEASQVTATSSDEVEDTAPEDIRCPICGSETAIRTAKKGKRVGSQFYVCTRYPECKGKIAVE